MVEVRDVLHVPGISSNLLSVSQMVSKGNVVIFDVNGCRIYNKDESLVASGSLHQDMYKLDCPQLNRCFMTTVNDENVDKKFNRGLLNKNQINRIN